MAAKLEFHLIFRTAQEDVFHISKKSPHCLRGGKTGSSTPAEQPASKWKLCKGLSVSLAEARADSLPVS